jgi:hypothetical protein
MIIFVYLYSDLPESQDANLCSMAGEGIRMVYDLAVVPDSVLEIELLVLSFALTLLAAILVPSLAHALPSSSLSSWRNSRGLVIENWM